MGLRGRCFINQPKIPLSLLPLNYIKTKSHQPNPTSCQVLLPTSNSDHFSFPLSILQSVAKMGNCSALRSLQPSVVSPHRAGCAAGEALKSAPPTRRTLIASSQQSCPAPRGSFSQSRSLSASSHLLRSVNKSQSRLHFAQLTYGAPPSPSPCTPRLRISSHEAKGNPKDSVCVCAREVS